MFHNDTALQNALLKGLGQLDAGLPLSPITPRSDPSSVLGRARLGSIRARSSAEMKEWLLLAKTQIDETHEGTGAANAIVDYLSGYGRKHFMSFMMGVSRGFNQAIRSWGQLETLLLTNFKLGWEDDGSRGQGQLVPKSKQPKHPVLDSGLMTSTIRQMAIKGFGKQGVEDQDKMTRVALVSSLCPWSWRS